MAWTIILEDENKETISVLSKELDIGFVDLSNFKLLCYLDPFNDTVFNQIQMTDLINDLLLLRKILNRPIIDDILNLAEVCKKEKNTFLIFYGD